VYVAAVRLLWQNQTDKFGLCSVVELLSKSESHWSMINRIVIKIYEIKQLNYNTDIPIKAGTFIYIYLTVSTARMLAASMQCWRMMRALRSHGRCWLVVSSDEMSPRASRSWTSSVTDHRLITDLSTAPYDQKDLCVFCRTYTSVESLTTIATTDIQEAVVARFATSWHQKSMEV